MERSVTQVWPSGTSWYAIAGNGIGNTAGHLPIYYCELVTEAVVVVRRVPFINDGHNSVRGLVGKRTDPGFDGKILTGAEIQRWRVRHKNIASHAIEIERPSDFAVRGTKAILPCA